MSLRQQVASRIPNYKTQYWSNSETLGWNMSFTGDDGLEGGVLVGVFGGSTFGRSSLMISVGFRFCIVFTGVGAAALLPSFQDK